MLELLHSAWRYRLFILSSIRNEFRRSFARSKLGGLWIVLQPLMQVLIYAVVLSGIMAAKLPGIPGRFSYAIYLTSGILTWSLFSEVVSRSLTIFIDNANLLKKMRFPRICLPLIVSGTAILNSSILLAVIIVLFGLLGHYPVLHILWMPIILGVTLMLGVGLGLILGVLNVFIRDVGQIVPILLQLGFWFTPIVYPVTIIPSNLRGWIVLNPIYHVVAASHSVMAHGSAPEWTGLLITGGIGVVLLVFALWLFRRASIEMPDAL